MPKPRTSIGEEVPKGTSLEIDQAPAVGIEALIMAKLATTAGIDVRLNVWAGVG